MQGVESASDARRLTVHDFELLNKSAKGLLVYSTYTKGYE